ncbi:MAG: PEP-CTERM sorting domain-containing protein [Betaproteobacteria bacterium]
MSADGGNTGAYLTATANGNAGDTIWFGGIKTDYTYTPATQGGFRFLSVSTNLLHAVAGGTGRELIVEQGGKRYYSPLEGFSTNSSWLNYTAAFLAASDFDTNPWAGNFGVPPDGNHPDFGSSGPPIRFGFLFGNGIDVGTFTNTVGLDTYLVTTSIVPEPEQAAFVVLGLGVMGFLTRRRSRIFG